MIVDSHLHVWNPDSASEPWRAGWRDHAPARAFGIDDALAAMDGAGVARALLIPTAWDRFGDRLVEEAVRRHPDRFLGVGVMSSREPRSAADLAGWARRTGLAGLRQVFPPGAAVSWLETGVVDWLWPAVEEAGLPIFVWAPGQLRGLARVLERHRSLRLILDHLNLPMAGTPAELESEVSALCELASFPRVAVKASALPCLATDPYPYRSLEPLVRRVVDAFGAERVFWGTDLMRIPCTYQEAVAMFARHLPSLSRAERRLVLGDALLSWSEEPR